MSASCNATSSGMAQLRSRLQGVKTYGPGYRANCPACGGNSKKLSMAEGDGGRVLIHCFAGCRAADVLAAVGLTWANVMPPKYWPESPGERRQMRLAIRDAGLASALEVLSLEATIALFAARELHLTGGLSLEDGKRLAVAVERITSARTVLCE